MSENPKIRFYIALNKCPCPCYLIHNYPCLDVLTSTKLCLTKV